MSGFLVVVESFEGFEFFLDFLEFGVVLLCLELVDFWDGVGGSVNSFEYLFGGVFVRLVGMCIVVFEVGCESFGFFVNVVEVDSFFIFSEEE